MIVLTVTFSFFYLLDWILADLMFFVFYKAKCARPKNRARLRAFASPSVPNWHRTSNLSRPGIIVPWYITVVCSVYNTWSITKETPAEYLPLQKQPLADVYKKGLLYNFFYRKTPLPESLFEDFVFFQPTTLFKKKFRHRCFPANFTRFLRTPAVCITRSRKANK